MTVAIRELAPTIYYWMLCLLFLKTTRCGRDLPGICCSSLMVQMRGPRLRSLNPHRCYFPFILNFSLIYVPYLQVDYMLFLKSFYLRFNERFLRARILSSPLISRASSITLGANIAGHQVFADWLFCMPWAPCHGCFLLPLPHHVNLPPHTRPDVT